jgi:uncharacterized protein
VNVLTGCLIVDGYNIINAWPELRTIQEDNLEDAREKLIERLENYRAYKGIKAILVFDAHMVKGSTEKHEYFGCLEIVYTKEHETADAYIEKLVNQVGRLYDIKVATSDWLEQQIVLGRGASRVSARELHTEVKNAQISMKNKYNIKLSAEKQTIENRIDPKILEKLEKMRRER